MSYGVEVKVKRHWSNFSIWDVVGTTYCDDRNGEIKNRVVEPNTVFNIIIYEANHPADPGKFEVSGLADGGAETKRKYEIRATDSKVTFPDEIVTCPGEDEGGEFTYSHKSTVEMIREKPKFDEFVLAIRTRLTQFQQEEEDASKGD